MKIQNVLNDTYITWFSRIAIFFDYFVFGFLKVIGKSPAAELVTSLQVKTLSFIPSDVFMIILGISECLIGIAFLVPKLNKFVFFILAMHIFTTLLPLLLLPEMAWSEFLIPTMSGQYIMKNFVLLALGANLYLKSI